MKIEERNMFIVNGKPFNTKEEAEAEVRRLFAVSLSDAVYEAVDMDGVVDAEGAVTSILVKLRDMDKISKKRIQELIDIVDRYK